MNSPLRDTDGMARSGEVGAVDAVKNRTRSTNFVRN